MAVKKSASVKKSAAKKSAPVKKAAAKKVVVEKKTGEKYASKAAMKKHEGGEGKRMQFMEMMAAKKGTAKKSPAKKVAKKGK
jgi:hypothetical protein